MGGTLYYVLGDHLGSTVAVSDAAGGEVGRVQYDPYGEVITSTLPADLTDRLFTGARFDGTIGLYQMGARWYDPALGRWTQADCIVPNPTNPQDLNRYTYVRNNPCRYTDPSGHCDPVFCPIVLTYLAFRYLPKEFFAFGARQVAQADIPVVSDFAAWDVQNTDLVWQAIHGTDLQGNPLTAQERLDVGFEGYWGFLGEAFTIYTVYEGVGALWQLGKAAYEGVTNRPSPPRGYIRAVPEDQVGTSQPFKTRPGEDGLSVFEGVSPEEVLAELPGRRVPNTTVTIPKEGLPSGTQVIPTQNPSLSQRLSEAHRILVRPEGWSVKRFAKVIKALVGWE